MLVPRSPMAGDLRFVNRRAALTASVTIFCRVDFVNFKMKFPFRYRVNTLGTCLARECSVMHSAPKKYRFCCRLVNIIHNFFYVYLVVNISIYLDGAQVASPRAFEFSSTCQAVSSLTSPLLLLIISGTINLLVIASLNTSRTSYPMVAPMSSQRIATAMMGNHCTYLAVGAIIPFA